MLDRLLERIFRFSSLAIALASLVSCSKETNLTDRHVYVILIDKSASITYEKNSFFSSYLDMVFRSITPNSIVIVEAVLDAGTFSNPPILPRSVLPNVLLRKKGIDYYLLKGNASKDPVCLTKTEAELRVFYEARTKLRTAVNNSIAVLKPSRKTYLIDGMREVSADLQGLDAPYKTIVVFTDGLEDSDTIGPRSKFEDENFWRAHKPSDLIKRLLDTTGVSNLHGSTVYMVGLSSSNTKVYENVLNFWDLYLNAAKVKSINIGHQPTYGAKDFVAESKDLCEGN